MATHRILIVGDPDGLNLESSFGRAFTELGYQVTPFSICERLRSHMRMGAIGRTLHSISPVETWVRKANRDLVLAVLQSDYDIILVFGAIDVQPGALAQIRTSTSSRLAWVWPDPLVNISDRIAACFKMCHAVFTFSAASVPVLRRFGSDQVIWLPLAGDPAIHPLVDRLPVADLRTYGADISFVGGWRPEREATLARLAHHNIKIWGPDWGRRCVTDSVRKAWQGRALRGPEFAKAVSATAINLNVIDGTIPGSANMRFFEILSAGGLQLCTRCADMMPIFRDEEHLFYFSSPEEMVQRIRILLADPTLRARVAAAGNALLEAQHTYIHRAEYVVASLTETQIGCRQGERP